MDRIQSHRGYCLEAVEHSPGFCVNFAPDQTGSLADGSPYFAFSLGEAMAGAKALIDEHLDTMGRAYPSGFKV